MISIDLYLDKHGAISDPIREYHAILLSEILQVPVEVLKDKSKDELTSLLLRSYVTPEQFGRVSDALNRSLPGKEWVPGDSPRLGRSQQRERRRR